MKTIGKPHKITSGIALILFTISCFSLRAQFVTIPDANFVTYLQSVVPSAMSGNQMDTTNTAVTVSTQTINVYNKNISDLYGVQFFKNLKGLNCQTNNLTSLPSLPNTLTVLHCAGNAISSVPNLPGNLTDLSCSYNSLTSLPVLPPGLLTLSCGYNQIDSLPSNLPHSMTYLDCGANAIAVLPSLPPTLTYLDCSTNPITSLPTLPSGLTKLYCAYDNLLSLPTLPNSITWMRCGGNPNLTTLPTLPTSLVTLECQDNYFTSLPSFPNSITALDIYNTFYLTTFPAWPTSLGFLDCNHGYQITSLPPFPSQVYFINCSASPHLKSLPALPASVQYLNTAYDSIYCFPAFPAATTTCSILPNDVVNCLPNHLPCMDATTQSLPLCPSGNSNGCPVATGIHEISFSNSISVFPNPATDMLFLISDGDINSEKARIVIQNSLGQPVRELPFAKSLSVADLLTGWYSIQISMKDGILRGKFIKQ